MIRKYIFMAALIMCCLFVVSPAFAVTNVNTTVDEYDTGADCSLREAVQAVNISADFGGCLFTGNTIVVPGGTYQLTLTGRNEDGNATGDLDLLANITIEGEGVDLVTIDGIDMDRVLHVAPTVSANIRKITLVNGDADGMGTPGSGGAILNDGGTLSVSNSALNDNHADRAGGGIESTNGGTLNIISTDFTNNSTGSNPGNGGAIHVTGAGNSTISGGTVSGNTATAEGGGFWNNTGTMNVTNVNFSGNSAAGDAADQGGGALFNIGGVLNVNGGIIDDNHATGTAGSGGGILNDGGTLNVSGTTISNNTAKRAGGGIETTGVLNLDSVDFTTNTTGSMPGNGGALHVTGSPTVTANGGTVSGNIAAREGGGFWNGSGLMTVNGTTFTNNVANGVELHDGGGALFNNKGQLEVSNAVIDNNHAPGAAGSGGGIFNLEGGLYVGNTTIKNNSASRAGGGVEDNTPGSKNPGVPSAEFSNVNFQNNTTGNAPGNGGAIHVTGDSLVEISGGSVISNTAASEGGGFWNNKGEMNVSGTTFTDNVASGESADNGGGALFNNGGVMNVMNAMISLNKATGASGSGGGALSDGGVLNISGSTFDSNTSNRAGGGIETTNDASLSLTDVNFNNNETGNAPGNGGAVHITGAGSATISGGSVTGNTAASEGGGFWNGTGTMTITGVDFSANNAAGAGADQGGGALFNAGGTLNVNGGTISGNTATGASGSGGGILNDGGTLTISNANLENNSSMRAGGGIEGNVGTMTVTDTDFRHNSTGDAPGNGGAIHITGAGNATIVNGTAANNTAASEGGGFWNGSGTMSVKGTILANNMANGNDATNGGGGLFNAGGTLLVSETMINDNVAGGTSGSGGGIFNDDGTLTVEDSTITRNEAVRAGGGIEDRSATRSATTTTITRVLLTLNRAGRMAGANPGSGGGLHISGAGNVTISESTVSSNHAVNDGGGLWNSGSGSMTVSQSLLFDNQANNNGGGLYNLGALTVANSTVGENHANEGGGLHNTGAGATSDVTNATFYENYITDGGTGLIGGINNVDGTVTLQNSIVAHVALNGADCSANVTAGANNLDSDGTCDNAATGDPELEPLDNNGGETQTYALKDSSPAISAGDAAVCQAAPVNGVDQRGFSRPVASCDLGAYELDDNQLAVGLVSAEIVPTSTTILFTLTTLLGLTMVAVWRKRAL